MEIPAAPLPKIPAATYRLQFNRHFRFSDAREIVSYLHQLGISDIYASPYFRASKESLHGYDIVDPTMLNPEVGTEAEYDALIRELRRLGMGQILDIVPNHMSWDSDNSWWMDILENGPSSPAAAFFSIDWHHWSEKLSGKLLVPFLGEPYKEALESRKLRLVLQEGTFLISYFDLRLPLAPESYVLILGHRLDDLRNRLAGNDPDLAELLSVIRELALLPPATDKDRAKLKERCREKEIAKKRLAALYLKNGEIKSFLEENLRIFNGIGNDPQSFGLLDQLLSRQFWRLAHWHVATEEIDYRRFFDINGLAAVRVEDPEIFDGTHQLILKLVGEGKVSGLRVDHPDGLHNPEQYLERLQRRCFSTLLERTPAGDARERANDDPQGAQRYEGLLSENPQYKPFYIVAEKILTGDEELPHEWRVFGTTGYDFLNIANGIFIDAGSVVRFNNLYRNFTGAGDVFSRVVHDKRKFIMQRVMAGEMQNLGHCLAKISERTRHSRDFTQQGLTLALIEIIACFPVYRTYIHSRPVSRRDGGYIEAAVEKARQNNRHIDASVFTFLRDILLLRFPDSLTDGDKREWLDFAMLFQQTSAPVMAKGVEDTAFYVYNRLLSLNEVGGDPGRFGIPVREFHEWSGQRFSSWPHTMNATSTHDTKRGEDLRARINVLTEIPDTWEKKLLLWGRLNGRQRVFCKGRIVPDDNEEYFLYQTLLGAWPPGRPDDRELADFRKRIQGYTVKALREAKVHSGWINPDQDYEGAVTSFIEAILMANPTNEFLRDFIPFQKTVSFFGMLNSLAQLLLKIASPGVPDFFQGTELWDLNLVDPDNRRPVDFARRRELLASLEMDKVNHGPDLSPFLKQLMAGWEDGMVKLYVTRQALNFRRENHALFLTGAYVPLDCEGKLREHICAFARQGNGKDVLVVVPRIMANVLRFTAEATAMSRVWKNTALTLPAEIPGSVFRNILTEERVETTRAAEKRLLPLEDLFSCLPVAMLEPAGQATDSTR